MDVLATFAHVLVPGLVVGLATMLCRIPRAENIWAIDWATEDRKNWHDRQEEGIPGLEYPKFVLKDFLETPRFTIISLILAYCAVKLYLARHSVTGLKKCLIGIIFVTTLAARCLSIFSSLNHHFLDDWFYVPTSGSNPIKGILIYWLITRPIWTTIYLGNYNDDEVMPIRRIDFAEPHVCGSKEEPERADEMTGRDLEASKYTMSSGRSYTALNLIFHLLGVGLPLSWRDVSVRLGYYSLMDNFVHILWLRYFWSFNDDKPYTEYLNNSEILTAALAMEVVVWVILRMWEQKQVARSNEKLLETVSEPREAVFRMRSSCPCKGEPVTWDFIGVFRGSENQDGKKMVA